jgi:hypothetical protein
MIIERAFYPASRSKMTDQMKKKHFILLLRLRCTMPIVTFCTGSKYVGQATEGSVAYQMAPVAYLPAQEYI